MMHFAKPEQLEQLTLHPEAKRVEGASGLSYLSVPENVINPDAVKRFCPLANAERYRDVLITPLSADGSQLNAPYDG